MDTIQASNLALGKSDLLLCSLSLTITLLYIAPHPPHWKIWLSDVPSWFLRNWWYGKFERKGMCVCLLSIISFMGMDTFWALSYTSQMVSLVESNLLFNSFFVISVHIFKTFYGSFPNAYLFFIVCVSFNLISCVSLIVLSILIIWYFQTVL